MTASSDQNEEAMAKRSVPSSNFLWDQPPLKQNRSNEEELSCHGRYPYLSNDVSIEAVTSPDISFANILLCDDILMRILQYADLQSLVRFTRGTSKGLLRRFHPSNNTSFCCDNQESSSDFVYGIWRDVFTRLNLAPLETSSASVSTSKRYPRRISSIHSNLCLKQLSSPTSTSEYFNAIRHRHNLFFNLMGRPIRNKSKKAIKQCFSLPDRYFNFVPLVPPELLRFPPSSQFGNANDALGDAARISYFEEDGANEDDRIEERFVVDGNIAHREDEDNDQMEDWDNMDGIIDPPPVEFACDSFALTSPGTGEEFVLLNPFSGSIEVYNSVLDNAIGSEESMLEQALFDASENILRKRGQGCGNGGSDRANLKSSIDDEEIPDENSEDIAGETIHRSIQQSHREREYDAPPKQVLFSVQDYFDLDVEQYFGKHTPFRVEGNRDGNVDVDWVGIDSHVALEDDAKSLAGNMIGAARILTMEANRGEDDLACTEVFAWSNFESNVDADGNEAYEMHPSEKYSSQYVCRAAGSFYYLDINAKHRKVYAAFQLGSNPFADEGRESGRPAERTNRELMDIDDESIVGENGEPIPLSKRIYCLPLIKCNHDQTSPSAIRSLFPKPDACFKAQYPVSSFSIDSTGNTLIAGTIYGTIEIWDTRIASGMKLSRKLSPQRLSIRESFLKRARSMTVDEHSNSKASAVPDDKSSTTENSSSLADAETTTQDDLALLESNLDEEIPHKHPTSRISQIYLPRHMPVQQSGFITKQRNADCGTTLLLWQRATSSNSSGFQIMSMIKLPLAAQCHPEVYYDGRRLVVFGKDHIGLIFLVYHVLSTRFDQHDFEEPHCQSKSSSCGSQSVNGNGEESGGVVNLHPKERRVKFVNRIRHAGLDGLEYYDSMLLTANERFLVVNTKTGGLIGSDGNRNATQGLLVIDLQEHGSD